MVDIVIASTMTILDVTLSTRHIRRDIVDADHPYCFLVVGEQEKSLNNRTTMMIQEFPPIS